jgi:hypothetical protein
MPLFLTSFLPLNNIRKKTSGQPALEKRPTSPKGSLRRAMCLLAGMRLSSGGKFIHIESVSGDIS